MSEFGGRNAVVTGSGRGIGRATAELLAANEVAEVIAFLASDHASFMTGAALTVDGGAHRHA